MKLDHSSPTMYGAFGISEKRNRYIIAIIWWAIIYNHHLNKTLYKDSDEVPDNLSKRSSVIEYILNELPDSEAERLFAMGEYKKIDILTDDDLEAKKSLGLCFLKAKMLEWDKEAFIKFFCEQLFEIKE